MITDKPPHLTEEELVEIHRVLARQRELGGYEVGKWGVSYYNRNAKVLGAAWPESFPDTVEVRDITLRVIEQVPGVTLTKAQRLRLGEALLDAGVSSIEISAHGWGQTTADLKEQVVHLKSILPSLQVKMGATMNAQMVREAAEVGVTLAEFWLPSIPEITPLYWSEAYRLAWDGADWRHSGIPRDLDEEIEVATRLVREIKSNGLRASAGVNLLTMVNDQHLERYCTAVARAGADEIWLSDGSCGLGPEAWLHVITMTKTLAPLCRVGVYMRDAFGLAVANIVQCVHAGAAVVEASVNGIAGGAGLPDLSQVATALEVLYGVRTGINLSNLTALSRLVEDISGVKVPSSHAVTGRNAHNWGGTEITVQELKVDPLIHWALEPSVVGGCREWSISVTSGMWTIKDKLDQIGASVPREDMALVRQMLIAEMALRRRSLTDEEILDVASRACAR